MGQRCPRLKHGRTRDFSRQTGGLLQPNMCECRPITSNIRLPINRKLLGGRLARQLYALRSRLLRPRAENLATSRQPVRPEVVTHVSGTLCYRDLRAGQRLVGGESGTAVEPSPRRPTGRSEEKVQGDCPSRRSSQLACVQGANRPHFIALFVVDFTLSRGRSLLA